MYWVSSKGALSVSNSICLPIDYWPLPMRVCWRWACLSLYRSSSLISAMASLGSIPSLASFEAPFHCTHPSLALKRFQIHVYTYEIRSQQGMGMPLSLSLHQAPNVISPAGKYQWKCCLPSLMMGKKNNTMIESKVTHTLWKLAEKGLTGARMFKEQRTVVGSIFRSFMLERKNLVQKDTDIYLLRLSHLESRVWSNNSIIISDNRATRVIVTISLMWNIRISLGI